MKRKNAKKLIAAAVSVAMCAAAFVGMAYSASAAQELNPTITFIPLIKYLTRNPHKKQRTVLWIM